MAGCINYRAVAWAAVLSACANSSVLAEGNIGRGQQLYQTRCTACHSVDTNRVGPLHAGVFGRKAGSVPGYAYSSALKSSKVVWNEKTLDRWLVNPEAFIPGQAMFVSVSDSAQRADLIAYLATLKAK